LQCQDNTVYLGSVNINLDAVIKLGDACAHEGR
jgi:hypothetical protein